MPKKKESKFPRLNRMFKDPKKIIRGITKTKEPFQRGEGSERYQEFGKAFRKRDKREAKDKKFYEDLNRKLREKKAKTK